MNQTTNTTAGIDLDTAQLDKLEALANEAKVHGAWPFHEIAFRKAVDPTTVLQLIQLARRSTSGSDFQVRVDIEKAGDSARKVSVRMDRASGSAGTAASGLPPLPNTTLETKLAGYTVPVYGAQHMRDYGLACIAIGRGAALTDAIVHSTGGFQVFSNGSTQYIELHPGTLNGVPLGEVQRVELTPEARRYYAELAATCQPLADERALFEHAEHASDLTRDEDYPTDYANPCVQSAWEGWQARAALAQQSPAPVVAHDAPEAAHADGMPDRGAAQDDKRDAERYRALRAGNDYAKDGAPMVLLYEKGYDDGQRPYWVISGEVLDNAADALVVASPASQPVAPEAAQAGGLIAEVQGCFQAAEVEGLAAALAETTDLRLKDLVERRLMHALYAANAAKDTTVPGHSEREAANVGGLSIDLIHDLRDAINIARDRADGSGYTTRMEYWKDVSLRLEEYVRSSQSPATIAAGQEAANAKDAK